MPSPRDEESNSFQYRNRTSSIIASNAVRRVFIDPDQYKFLQSIEPSIFTGRENSSLLHSAGTDAVVLSSILTDHLISSESRDHDCQRHKPSRNRDWKETTRSFVLDLSAVLNNVCRARSSFTTFSSRTYQEVEGHLQKIAAIIRDLRSCIIKRSSCHPHLVEPLEGHPKLIQDSSAESNSDLSMTPSFLRAPEHADLLLRTRLLELNRELSRLLEAVAHEADAHVATRSPPPPLTDTAAPASATTAKADSDQKAEEEVRLMQEVRGAALALSALCNVPPARALAETGSVSTLGSPVGSTLSQIPARRICAHVGVRAGSRSVQKSDQGDSKGGAAWGLGSRPAIRSAVADLLRLRRGSQPGASRSGQLPPPPAAVRMSSSHGRLPADPDHDDPSTVTAPDAGRGHPNPKPAAARGGGAPPRRRGSGGCRGFGGRRRCAPPPPPPLVVDYPGLVPRRPSRSGASGGPRQEILLAAAVAAGGAMISDPSLGGDAAVAEDHGGSTSLTSDLTRMIGGPVPAGGGIGDVAPDLARRFWPAPPPARQPTAAGRGFRRRRRSAGRSPLRRMSAAGSAAAAGLARPPPPPPLPPPPPPIPVLIPVLQAVDGSPSGYRGDAAAPPPKPLGPWAPAPPSGLLHRLPAPRLRLVVATSPAACSRDLCGARRGMGGSARLLTAPAPAPAGADCSGGVCSEHPGSSSGDFLKDRRQGGKSQSPPLPPPPGGRYSHLPSGARAFLGRLGRPVPGAGPGHGLPSAAHASS